MDKYWKVLKFNLPPELEGFAEEQEKIIKNVLECLNIEFKYINDNWVFLLKNSIDPDHIDTIKDQLLIAFKEEFRCQVRTVNIKEYRERDIYLYKIIFPKKFSTEYLEIEKIEKKFGFHEKKGHDLSIYALEADVDENVLFFESKNQIPDLHREMINFLENTTADWLFEMINFEVEVSDKWEILFSFEIHEGNIEEEEILDFVQSISDLKIINEDSENNIIKEIEYQYGIQNNKVLVHDIQKDKILVCTYQKCVEFGLFFLGYMKNNAGNILITIKGFEYEIVQELFAKFSQKYNNIAVENHLLWLRLLSRKVSQDYHTSKRNIEDNQHCKDFLEATKKVQSSDYALYFLRKILKNGYLTEEEYEAKVENCEGALKEQKDFSKFLQRYIRVNKELMQRNDIASCWINPLSSKVYIEKKAKTDHYRIEDFTNKLPTIFAPTDQLLFYIKTFWHQNYVLEIINSIKQEFADKNDDLQIMNVIPDSQFNLRDRYDKTKSSIDIDILLKLKRSSQNKDYIIAIEAKQKSSELRAAIGDITKKNKIAYEYANIFDGFLMIAYIDDMTKETKIDLAKPEYCKVLFSAAQAGMEKIEKQYLLSVDHSFTRLKQDVVINIEKICKI